LPNVVNQKFDRVRDFHALEVQGRPCEAPPSGQDPIRILSLRIHSLHSSCWMTSGRVFSSALREQKVTIQNPVKAGERSARFAGIARVRA
jgi:hypothetical protein